MYNSISLALCHCIACMLFWVMEHFIPSFETYCCLKEQSNTKRSSSHKRRKEKRLSYWKSIWFPELAIAEQSINTEWSNWSLWFLLLFTRYFALHNPHIAATSFFYSSLHTTWIKASQFFLDLCALQKLCRENSNLLVSLLGVPPRQKSHFSLLVSCLILLFFSSFHRGGPLG